MLLLASYDVVFQEVPGEVTLALNLAACPNHCPGCHSPHLRESTGEVLDTELLNALLARYGGAVTCVAFMGGDGDPAEVNHLAAKVHAWTGENAATGVSGAGGGLKTAWYSGRNELSAVVSLKNLDFVKLGAYDPSRGGLDSPDTTNQCFYRIENENDSRAEGADGAGDRGDAACGNGAGRRMVDVTELFRKR